MRSDFVLWRITHSHGTKLPTLNKADVLRPSTADHDVKKLELAREQRRRDDDKESRETAMG